MNDEIRIRNAEIKDVSIILKLIKSLAEYEKLSHQFINNIELLTKYLFGERKFAEVLLAELNNEPVGFALYFHNYSTFVGKPGIYLEDLFVRPEMRGKGIGKKLFLELVKIAKNRDCGRVEWSVLNWNSSAIGFYKSLGAVPMEEWTVYRLTEEKINELANHV
ncbi:MAG: GNAT family N-acetyltransferase [Ignavibacteriaceae bacterium]|nr:GNAT family N-acetyltransferase [Ignavibacteriaceae bacterium]